MSKEPNRNVYVGHRYVPKIMGEWNKQNDYEGLSIVTHQGNSYTSKKRVPVGIDIKNEEFWVVTGNYNAQVEDYREETERVAKDLLLKSDKTYVDTELGKKSDKTYVDTELNKKANQTYVDTELGKKSDKTYVDTELNKKANKTYVDTEFKNVKDDIESNHSEVIQARGGEDLLKDRLDKTDSNLADTDRKIDIRQHDYNRKPIVSFQFDDAQMTDWTRFKPIFDSEGIPGNVCVITENIGKTDGVWLQPEHLKTFKESGWTVSSHTHRHLRLGELSEQALDYELKTSRDIMKDLGLDHDILVYPYGSYSDLAIRMTRKYYQYAIDIHRNNPNYPPHFENMKISRVSGLSQPNTTLADCKASVDEALETGNWVIFEDHSHYTFYNNSGNLELLRELIQYVKSKGIEIVNIREGIERKANIIEVGDSTKREYFKLARSGEIASPDSAYKMSIARSGLSIDTPITEFRKGAVENIRMTNIESEQGGFPEGRGGTLIVNRPTSDSYAFQIFYIYDSNHVYKRRWNNVSMEWEQWDSLFPGLLVSLENEYSASSPLTDFPENKTTVTVISEDRGFPATVGKLTTENYGLNSFQIFKSGARTYRRRWLSTSEWSPFTLDGENLGSYTQEQFNAITPVPNDRGRMVTVRGTDNEDELRVYVRLANGSFTWKKVVLE